LNHLTVPVTVDIDISYTFSKVIKAFL